MPQLSTAIIRGTRIFRNMFIDLRFGKILGGTYLNTSIKTDNSDYEALSRIFNNQIKEDDVLVDVGCGNGRVINWWLQHHPTNQMFGIELSKEIATTTQNRLKKYSNVTIIQGDAIKNLPHHGTLFYFYNPFGRDIVKQFKEQIERQFTSDDNVRFLYYNCKHIDLFKNDAHWQVENINLKGPSSAPFDPLAVLTLTI